MRIQMPQLGESVTEGTLAAWLKQPGERIKRYEAIAEVITDKVNAEIPSPVSGIVQTLLIEAGATVEVGQDIAVIAEEGSVADEEPAAEAAGSHPSNMSAATAVASGAPGEGSERYSPVVRRLAREHGLDLSRIEGTGVLGRVTRRDVEVYIERQKSAETLDRPAPRAEPSAREPLPAPQTPQPAGDEPGDQVIIPDPVRRTIARRMVQVKQEAPHAWTMVEADLTGLVQLRRERKAEFRQREGVDLTYLPFAVLAAVEALREYPILNAAWMDDRIIVRSRIHISLAVATDRGLVVPVLRNADRLSISGVARGIDDLVVRARGGRLTVDDMQGGTFTVNNTGSFGSILSAPILNPPQAGIVTIEAIQRRPVVVGEDAIAIRHMANLCLSFDHRVIDGWTAGQFLQSMKRRLAAFGPETAI